MALPPLHRVDHVPTYILSFDTAWDHDRIGEELAAIADPDQESPWASRGNHPWIRYCSGESRCDLETVTPWLKPGGDPVSFVFRRLTVRERAMIESRAQTSAPAARNLALSYALISVEGAEVKLNRGGREPPHGLTDDDLQRLRELVGDDGLIELGNQAIACSRELLASEKKP
jgi:hypothetical protein